MAANMISKVDLVLHQRQSYNYPAPFSKCSITPPRAPTPSAAPTPLPSQAATVLTFLMLNPIQDPSYNTQSRVTLPSTKILDSDHYDIDQLDHTTSTTASYYYTNYPPYQFTLSSKERHFGKLCERKRPDNTLEEMPFVQCYSPYQSTLSSKERHFGKLRKRKLFSYERRSPSERDEMERFPRPISRQNTSDYDDGASNMSRSYNEPDFAMDEAEGLQRLRIDYSMRRSDGYSPSSVAGQKRRVEGISQSKSGVVKVHSEFVCDCCPTKQKKFETEETRKRVLSVADDIIPANQAVVHRGGEAVGVRILQEQVQEQKRS